jgi:aspartate carbamoyltransferase catalytic subunit
MHPGPMIRGLEITSEVADGPQSVIAEQVTNGVAIRMALIHRALAPEHSQSIGLRPVSSSPKALSKAAARAKQPAARKRGRA